MNTTFAPAIEEFSTIELTVALAGLPKGSQGKVIAVRQPNQLFLVEFIVGETTEERNISIRQCKGVQ